MSHACWVIEKPGTEPIDTLLGLAKAPWPEIDVSKDAFLSHLHSLGSQPSDAYLSEVYLTFACGLGHPLALAHFDQDYLTKACANLARRPDDMDFVADLKQRLREKLYSRTNEAGPRIWSYNGRAPLAAWLRVVALRASHNLRRDQRRDPHQDHQPLPDLLVGTGDPERSYIKAEARAQFKLCVEDALSTLSQDERGLLRLHLLSGLSIDALGKLYGIHRATAARRLARAQEHLAQEALRLFAQRLRLQEDEERALLSEVRSHLDLSFSRLFAKTFPDDNVP